MTARFFRIALTFLSFLTSLQMSAQRASEDKKTDKAAVYGELVLERIKAPVFDANVLLVQVNGNKVDSTYRVSARNGVFIFKNLRPGKVYIKATKMGMDPVDGVFDITAGDNAVLFTMRYSTEKIKESTVTASASLMRILGDTTVFNAAAVKTMDGDKAIAILEQLPGFDLSGGSIKYRGKRISRTYVNGVQIFGDNAKTAFDQLLADEVTHVKVYEEQNAEDKRRGLKNSAKEQVLDVTTKESILSFGSAAIQMSGGLDESKNESGKGQGRYYARGIANFYSEMDNAAVYLGTDNLCAPVEGIVSGGIPSVAMTFGPLNQYQESTGAQLEVTHRWKDRAYGNAVTGNYAFSNVYSRSVQRVLTDYFETENSPARSMADTTFSGSKRRRHDFGAGLYLQDTPLKSINLSIDGTLTEADQWAKASSLVASRAGDIRQNSNVESNADDLSLKGHLVWKNNDLYKIRPLVSLSGFFSDNKTTSWNVDTLSTSYIRRNLQSDGIGKNWDINLRGAMEILLANDTHKTSRLTVGASAKTERIKRRNLTLDIIDPESPVQDLANTYDYTWNTVSASLEQKYTFKKGKNELEASLKESLVSQKDNERLPADDSFDHSYLNFDSEVTFRRNYHVYSVSAKSMIPSLEQTRNRITDTNPLVLSGGNPNLGQQYQISAQATAFALRNPKTGFNIGYSLMASCTVNPIVTRTFYFTEDTTLSEYDGYTARQGSILNTFVNATDPAISANGLLSFSKRSQKIKLSSSLKFGGGYDRRPQYLRGDLAHVTSFNLNTQLVEMFNPSRHLSMTGNLKVLYSQANAKLNGVLSSSVITSLSASIKYEFKKPLFVNLTTSIQNYDYLSGAGVDNTIADMNAQIGYRFRKQGLTVSVSAHDLLSKASNYTTATTADYYMQKWNSSYGRYFLLNVKYELRKKNAFRR